MSVVVASAVFGMPVLAATIAPPMHDISAQCAGGRRSATAMSECIVAESEARAEILQKWDKVSDASAEKCLKLGKKAKKFPYAALAKCVAAEPVEVKASVPLVVPTETPAAPAGAAVTPPGRSLLPSWVRRWAPFEKNEAIR